MAITSTISTMKPSQYISGTSYTDLMKNSIKILAAFIVIQFFIQLSKMIRRVSAEMIYLRVEREEVALERKCLDVRNKHLDEEMKALRENIEKTFEERKDLIEQRDRLKSLVLTFQVEKSELLAKATAVYYKSEQVEEKERKVLERNRQLSDVADNLKDMQNNLTLQKQMVAQERFELSSKSNDLLSREELLELVKSKSIDSEIEEKIARLLRLIKISDAKSEDLKKQEEKIKFEQAKLLEQQRLLMDKKDS